MDKLEVIHNLSRNFVTKNYIGELELFDRIWSLQDLSVEPSIEPIPNAQHTGFIDNITSNPYFTDIVINLIASIIFQLGIFSAGKLIGLANDTLKKRTVSEKLSGKLRDEELVSRVLEYVYENIDDFVATSNDSEVHSHEDK